MSDILKEAEDRERWRELFARSSVEWVCVALEEGEEEGGWGDKGEQDAVKEERGEMLEEEGENTEEEEEGKWTERKVPGGKRDVR